MLFRSMIQNGIFTDQRSRTLELNNVIVVIEGIEEKNMIGFSNKEHKQEESFDEIIIKEDHKYSTLNQLYEQVLSRMNYEISFDFSIDPSNKKKVNTYLYEFTKKHQNGKYEIKKEDIFDFNVLSD